MALSPPRFCQFWQFVLSFFLSAVRRKTRDHGQRHQRDEHRLRGVPQPGSQGLRPQLEGGTINDVRKMIWIFEQLILVYIWL